MFEQSKVPKSVNKLKNEGAAALLCKSTDWESLYHPSSTEDKFLRYFVCLSSSFTHESPAYLVNNGDVQTFLSLCGKNPIII